MRSDLAQFNTPRRIVNISAVFVVLICCADLIDNLHAHTYHLILIRGPQGLCLNYHLWKVFIVALFPCCWDIVDGHSRFRPASEKFLPTSVSLSRIRTPLNTTVRTPTQRKLFVPSGGGRRSWHHPPSAPPCVPTDSRLPQTPHSPFSPPYLYRTMSETSSSTQPKEYRSCVTIRAIGKAGEDNTYLMQQGRNSFGRWVWSAYWLLVRVQEEGSVKLSEGEGGWRGA